MRPLPPLRACLVLLPLLLCGVPPHAGAQTPCEALLEQGARQGVRGEFVQAIQSLRNAYAIAATPQDKGRAAAALGAALLQQRRFAEALPLLEEALAAPIGDDLRAVAANDLGNLHAQQNRPDAAEGAYAQALRLAPTNAALMLAVELNRLRLPAPPRRAARLSALFERLGELADPREQARYSLNLASEAKTAGDIALAYRAFEKAHRLASGLREPRLLAEAYDGLGQLYEDRQRSDEAQRLTRAGIEQARSIDADELLIGLEWRQARLWQAQGNTAAAIAALRNAVSHIEAIRQDIPVTYQNGRSSFRDTLAPIYLSLADLQLKQAATQQGAERNASLRQARDSVELVKQTELEDYLGNRCGVGAARLGAATTASSVAARLPQGTAVIYPILLPDRIELLLETADGMERATVPADLAQFERTVREFLARLSDDILSPLAQGKQLYRWLLAPLEAHLKQTDTLVIIPDGILRRMPFAALHDGRDYLIQRFAVSTAPGLTLVSPSRGSSSGATVLLAGMSVPGDVIDKLSPALLNSIFPPSEVSPQRAMTGARALRRPVAGGAVRSAAQRDALRADLSLPGVKDEIEQLQRITAGETLFDEGFTLDNLRRQVGRSNYQVIHLATHGVFGPTADTTFVMTHDDLLTLDGLQQLVRKQSAANSRVELLTLSACQTAQGDDRAPLGLAGAAIQARAATALGSLWPVNDTAAARLMGDFYARLAGRASKAKSLQESQIALLKDPRFGHPYFWAPFILVGDWQ